MHKTTVKSRNYELSFTDEDVIDLDDIYYDGDYNPRNAQMFLIHDHGFTVAVVMADTLQDALDTAADTAKLDRWMIDPADPDNRHDYMTADPDECDDNPDQGPDYVDTDGKKWWWKHSPTFLGNASEPFDTDTLSVITFPLPERSLTALYGDTVEANDSGMCL